eukprot:4090003-Lingulodinium_polyedra.AAC.1
MLVTILIRLCVPNASAYVWRASRAACVSIWFLARGRRGHPGIWRPKPPFSWEDVVGKPRKY